MSTTTPNLKFTVIVRTGSGITKHHAFAISSCDAWQGAADAQGDMPFSITVMPAGAQ